MSEDVRPIVIKRIKKVAAVAHGGAWKIAYADFVTAMMAFFLLMWLLGSTAKGDLKGALPIISRIRSRSACPAARAGDATSILKGGGKDLTRSSGQVKDGDVEPRSKTVNLQGDQCREDAQGVRAREKAMLGELKQSIEKLIEGNPASSSSRTSC
jgi:chemotaxis protein MotB